MLLGQDTLQDYLNYNSNESSNFLFSMPGAGLGFFTENTFGLRSKLHFMGERRKVSLLEKHGIKDAKREHKKYATYKASKAESKAYNSYINRRGTHGPSRKPGNLWNGLNDEEAKTGGVLRAQAARKQTYSSYLKDKNKLENRIRHSPNTKKAIAIKSNIASTEKRWNRMGTVTAFGYAASMAFDLAREAFLPSIKNDGLATFDGQVPSLLDNNRTYTGRQRALMSIHNSQLHARAVLGNEAMYMA